MSMKHDTAAHTTLAFYTASDPRGASRVRSDSNMTYVPFFFRWYDNNA